MFNNIPNKFCAAHRTTISRIWTWLNVLQTYVIVICNCIGMFFCVRCEPHVFEYIKFKFWYCNPCLMIMFFNFWYYHVFFNFGIVIHVGWSCFSMYCNWYEIKFVCLIVLFIALTKKVSLDVRNEIDLEDASLPKITAWKVFLVTQWKNSNFNKDSEKVSVFQKSKHLRLCYIILYIYYNICI